MSFQRDLRTVSSKSTRHKSNGRPLGSGEGLRKEYNLRMTKEMYDQLTARAIADGGSIAETLRTFIEWGLEHKA